MNSYSAIDLSNTGLESGLDKRFSDYVGSVTYQPNQIFSLAARGRFDQQTFTPQRLELEGRANFERWTLQLLYGDYAQQPEIGFLNRREEILAGASFKMTQNWVLIGAARYNLAVGQFDQSRLGLGYVDDCVLLSFNYYSYFTYIGIPALRPQQCLHAAIEFAHARPGFPILRSASDIRFCRETVQSNSDKKREELEEQAVVRRRSREQELMLETSAGGRRGPLVAIMLAAAIVLGTSATARSQQVVAFVNGAPITTLDVEHRAKFMQLSTKKVPARKEVLDSLINEILELNEAKRFGIEIPEAEVDKAFAGAARRMGADVQRLTQALTAAGASADTFKRHLRAQLAWSTLVRGRYKASLEIRDKDVEAQLELHKSDKKEDVGYEYIMSPVVFIVPRGSPDAAYEARKRDADTLRARFQSCSEGIPFARALREVAVRDQVSKFSADLPQQLRDILDGTAVGHLTPPETTAEGVQMFAVCDKKETKSDTPEMREIRDQIFQQKFGAQAKRYLDNLRRGALIEYKMTEDNK